MKWNRDNEVIKFMSRGDVLFLVFLICFILFIAIQGSRAVRQEEEQTRQKGVIINLCAGKEVTLEKWMFDSPLIESVAEEWCFNHGVAANRMKVESRRLADKLYAIINHNKISLEQHPAETITTEGESK